MVAADNSTPEEARNEEQASRELDVVAREALHG